MRTLQYTELSQWLHQAQTTSSVTFSGVAVDSRHVLQGQLFFALPGAQTDGHHFLGDAAAKGALGAVVNIQYAGPSFGLELFRVDDTVQALQLIAKRLMERSRAKIIAFTGSLGKTTTKWLTYQLLKSTYKTATTSGSKNSQVGLALAIINESEGDEEYFVLEMGMSEKGQLSTLVQIAPPDIAVITAIALVHAENFSSLEEIAEAKCEILSHPRTQLALINADAACQDILLHAGPEHCLKERYSIVDPTATWYLHPDFAPPALQLFEKKQLFPLPYVDFPADHLYNNLLAAIAVARHAGMHIQEIAEIVPTLTLPEKRLQFVERRGVSFINDAYNASELSMKAALDVLAKRQVSGRKIAVLGHMRELGLFSEECHRRVGQHALPIVDELFCFGENCEPLVNEWRRAGRAVQWHNQFEELRDSVMETVREGDLVLVKGARSLELERIILTWFKS